jgi:YidC/Oxa1 family membrane protein insertase
MLTTLFVQPIFNVLSLIYALIPGHNFGLAIILFTVVARVVMYPLLRKQLKHTKAMREMQPEIKKIKKATKGNRQQESLMMMELYKEKEIKPMAFLGMMIIQIVIFLSLFSGLNRVINNHQEIVDFSYPAVQSLSWMQELSDDITKFDDTLVGQVDLSRSAVDSEEGFYFPAFLLVLGSAIIQFFQIRQTMPKDKDARKLRDILSDAKTGKEADNSEVNAAMGRNMGLIMPILIFVITIGFPAALALYWFVGGLIAYLQQSYLLKQDVELMGSSAVVVSKKPLRETPTKTITKTTKSKPKKAKTVSKNSPTKKKG